MNFEQWAKARGYDIETLSKPENAQLRADLEASFKAQTIKVETDFDRDVATTRKENERVSRVRELCLQAMQANVNNRTKIDRFDAIAAQAIAEKWDVQRVELEILREERRVGPLVLTPQTPQATDDVIEAAICVAHKLPDVEKKFSAQTLESAHKQFRRGIGIKRLMTMGARANGYRGDDDNFAGVSRAIIKGRDSVGVDDYGGYGMRADVSVSTGIQVPGILSNIANKYLANGFMNVDQSWRGIAKVRPVNDFKQTTTYRMAGANTFLRVAPSGEIKHGAMSENSYTNQAKTYGRLLGISREDYVNDDLGAFVSVSQELGRGAADGLNNIFWAVWLNDSAFFKTDKSYLNYDDGATDSVLSLAGLDNAESIFAVQTKPDGTFLGATAKILLVPPALKNSALGFMTATDLVVGTTAATGINKNVFAGRYSVVSSPYLAATSLKDENGVAQTVTGSSTAWYLLADPMDIAAIEVVFLYGKDTPTVETGEFEFDQLGFATRGYFDFGVALQEYRAGVKLKGAA